MNRRMRYGSKSAVSWVLVGQSLQLRVGGAEG